MLHFYHFWGASINNRYITIIGVFLSKNLVKTWTIDRCPVTFMVERESATRESKVRRSEEVPQLKASQSP